MVDAALLERRQGRVVEMSSRVAGRAHPSEKIRAQFYSCKHTSLISFVGESSGVRLSPAQKKRYS
jgi:hypothetical protein